MGPLVPQRAPWKHKAIKPNYEMRIKTNRQTDPAVIKQTFLEIIEEHTDYTTLYTDGSKNPQGSVGASYYISNFNIGRQFRISNNVSVYTAEMIAIREALRFITSYKITKAIIISDSLSVLKSLESGISQSRPNLLEEVKCMISNLFINQTCDLRFIWTPAHTGVVGNERADKLAKQALQRDGIDIPVPLELKKPTALLIAISQSNGNYSGTRQTKGDYIT